jgi:cellulose biosynthesis protein BcsQ
MLADHIIIPTSESYLELKSVTTIVALAIEYKTPYSILLSNVDIKTLAFRDAQKALSGMEGLLDSYVSRSTRMAECPATGTWIGDYWPSNILHLQYKRVTKELLSKLKGEKNEK